MSAAEQIPLFDLPPVEAQEAQAVETAPPQRSAPARKRLKQLALDVRFYNVRTAAAVYSVQAATPSAAKYAAFRQARTMGQYLYQGGFLAFVSGGCSVKEDRR
ncbi:hypothetical protein ACRQ5Q_14450 [Bradyrhizobium sp. PMVTL-01]|uniref:hypothetical protein n=1 Tax=Bradyrhizobium sp. PMVTL-01 TaxID=3434999 RepID=UPI003F6FA3B6